MDYARNVQMCYKCILLGTIILVLSHTNIVVQAAEAAAPSSASSSTPSAIPLTAQTQQIPLVRLPSNTLLKYTAYKDVSILHFRIPSDTRTALFSFKAYEESKSAFRKYFI